MDKVGGGLENETEDQILARALEESLRHYKEIEIPRLSQMTKDVEVTTEDYQETMAEEDMDCWEEWNVEDINDAMKLEESIVQGIQTEKNGMVNNKNTKASSQFMNNYLVHEIRPKQTCISVGEVGENGADGFDTESGRIWIYPSNYPVRKYQLDIVHSALFDNTLVSLPTGLGKTFIAAVIMYNFYRWFPMGKIIFLAPTRPLVAQQVHACYEIMGIPKNHTLELTGSKNASERAKAWKERRVFFATPQVAANDLATGACPGDLVRCVVVDEAHRAAGNHAICQAIRGLLRLREQSPGSRFRILALSATPGKNIPSVSNVVTTLRISKLELRDEQSPDVAPYTHHRNIETVVVPIGPELSETRNEFLKILIPVVERLTTKKVLYCGDKSKISKYQILSARANFRINAQGMSYHEKGLIEGDFALAITLSHALGLLLTHGQRTFMNFLQGTVDGDRGTPIVMSRLKNDYCLSSLLSKLKAKFGAADSMLQPAPDVSLSEKMAGAIEAKNEDKPFITSHPKMDHLKEIIMDHFEKYARSGESTRVMVFCEYRDPVVEICNMLMSYWPLIKPMSFVGQATASMGFDNVPGTSKGTKGFTQKQQMQAIRGFREGGYNVLVSTCVGEEGLDIGEVDLIICYDAPHSSPLRLVQRMGRTGRKREGRVVTLVTQDWEEHKHKAGLRQKNTIVRSLMNSKMLGNVLCRQNPRVLPPGINPTCHMMPMIIPQEEEDDNTKGKKGKGKGGKSKNHSNSKKGKGKSKAKADDGSGDEGMDENNEKGVNLESEEVVSKKGKGKGKTKGKKKVGKASPIKSQAKGIQDFFKNHRLKDPEPIFDVIEDFDDDDFMSDEKQQPKNLDDMHEVVTLDEDGPILNPESAVMRQSKDGTNFILSPDMKLLEAAVTNIYGNTHCSCMNSSFPLKCSIMASHFQLRHSTDDLPNLEPNMSLEFLTAELILNFDSKEEARKAGIWNLDIPLETVDDFSFKTIPYPLKKHLSINSLSKYFRGKSLASDVLEIDNVISYTRKSGSFMKKDAGQRLLKDKSFLKNRAQNISTDVFNAEPNNQEGKSLWNVFGKQKKMEVANEDLIVLEDDDDVEDSGIQNKTKISDDHSKKEVNIDRDKSNGNFSEIRGLQSISAKNFIPNDFDIGHLSFSGESTPDNLPLPKNTPLKSNEFSHMENPVKHQFDSPNTFDLKSAHGSEKETPDHLPLPQESISKSTLCLSPIIGNRKGNFVVTSSTPKVHRKNLFPTTMCASSPVKVEKSISANFDLMPSDVELSDHEEISPVNKKSLSPEKPLNASTKVDPPSISLPCEKVNNEIHDYIQPNFDLGWDDAFDSDATYVDLEDEAFEGLKVKDEGNDGSNEVSPLIKKSHHITLGSQKKDSKNERWSLAEKANDSSKSYVEKSSELCGGIGKKTPFTATREKLLKRKINDDIDSQPNHSHFYTVTQMIDMLADGEIPSTSAEVKKEGRSKMKVIEEDEDFTSKFGSDNILDKNISDVRESIERSPNKRVKMEAPENEILGGISSGKEELVPPQSINFDIGDDALLDISADLFAEDDTEDWLRESGETAKENLVIKDQIMDGQEETSEDKQIIPSTSKKGEHVTPSNSDKDLGSDDDFDFEILPKPIKRTEPQTLNSIMPAPSLPGLPGWKADWLIKTVPVSNNKLSLSRKNSKKEDESKEPLSSNKQSSSFKMPKCAGKDMKTETGVKPRSDFQDFVGKDYDGGSWIDEITTEKRETVRIPGNDPRKTSTQSGLKIQSTSSNLQNDKLGVSSCNNNFVNPQNKKPLDKVGIEESLSQSSCNMKDKIHLEGNSNNKFKCSDTKDNVKGSKSSSWGEEVAVVKPVSKQDVITLSSDEDDADCENKSEEKPADKRESWLKKYEEDICDEDDVDCGNKIEEKPADNRESWLKKYKEDIGDWQLSDWEVDEGYEIKDQEPIASSDDFESLENKRKPKITPLINSSKETCFSSEEKILIRPRKVSKSKKRCEFLESQAEVSFSELAIRKLSSDEDDDKGNSQYYDPSFINDGMPHSEEEEVDIQAKYLQSVRSPRNPKFKIPHLPAIISLKEDDPKTHDHESDSCYLNDSFCVDGESEENVSEQNEESSVDELEVLEAILSKKSKDKKKKKKKIESSSEDEVRVLNVKSSRDEQVKSKKAKRKRKRIVMHDSSDEDEALKCNPTPKRVSLGRITSPEFEQAKRSSADSSASNISPFKFKDKSEGISSRPVSSDSRGITERRTSKVSDNDDHRKPFDVNTNRDNGATSTSSNVLKNSESVNPSKSGNTVPGVLQEIKSNWSGDIFDLNLSDDEMWEAEFNIPSNSTKKDEESAFKHHIKSSGNLGNTPNGTVFKVPTTHHINTETKHNELFEKSKFIPKTEPGSSSNNPSNSSFTYGNNSKEQPSSHPKELPTPNVKTCVVTPFNSSASTSKMGTDFETLIVISPTEACRATDVVSTLRAIRKIQVVVFATSGTSFIPYALGRDLCLFRFSVSELGHGSKATEQLQAAKKLYRKISVILEWGDEVSRDQWPQRKSGNWNSSSSPTSLSSLACSTLMKLGNAGFKVLHSSGKNETATLIAEHARHHQRLEINSGLGPIILPKPFNQSDPKLKFYSSLPGVNPVQAIHILIKFPKISDFLSRCSSARSIQSSTGLDLNKSLQLYKTLSGVHTSDT